MALFHTHTYRDRLVPYEKMVVEAERDKQVQILASEAEAKQRVNAATAAAEQVRLAAIAESAASFFQSIC